MKDENYKNFFRFYIKNGLYKELLNGADSDEEYYFIQQLLPQVENEKRHLDRWLDLEPMNLNIEGPRK